MAFLGKLVKVNYRVINRDGTNCDKIARGKVTAEDEHSIEIDDIRTGRITIFKTVLVTLQEISEGDLNI